MNLADTAMVGNVSSQCRWSPAKKNMAYPSINPAKGEILKSFDKVTNLRLLETLFTAASCFETWRHTTFVERAAIAAKAASLLREHLDDFARRVSPEMGKLIADARGEVLLSANIIEYKGRNAKTVPAPHRLHPASGGAEIEHQPLSSINEVLERVEPGKVVPRVVLDFINS